MAKKTPEWDELIQISKGDLFHLLTCARSYDSRLPHGMIEGRFLELLTEDMVKELRK